MELASRLTSLSDRHLQDPHWVPTSKLYGSRNRGRLDRVGYSNGFTKYDALLTQQSTHYVNAVGACLDVTGCVGVTTWDFADEV
jgi:hypothetical protein